MHCWCVSLRCVNLHNQQHVLVMCAVAFYMMENYPLDVGSEFNAGIIQVGRGHTLEKVLIYCSNSFPASV